MASIDRRLRLAAIMFVVALVVRWSLPIAAAAPPSPSPIFQSHDTLTNIVLTAPFSDLFGRTRSWVSDHQVPSDDDDDERMPDVTGTLEYTSPEGAIVRLNKVKIVVRGNTSRDKDECVFPKLTLKFGASPKGTIFAGQKHIKLGTHCGETDVASKIGRLRNQHAPIRESLIYTVLSRTNTVSLLSRPAIVTYVDTSSRVDRDSFPSSTLTRNAFFLEDADTAADRIRAKIVQKSGPRPRPAAFVDADHDPIDSSNLVLSIFAEALTENRDWYLKMSSNDVVERWKVYSNWNIHMLKAQGPKLLTMVYDWDLSGWVRGPWPEFDPFEFATARLAAAPQVTQPIVDQARADFLAAREQIYRDVEAAFDTPAASGDVEGLKNVRNHLDRFYAWIAKPLKVGL
jgi:hypothetical protein